MKFTKAIALTTLFGASLAAPSPHPKGNEEPENKDVNLKLVRVTVQHEKKTSNTEFAITDPDTKKTLAHMCADSLGGSTAPDAFPVAVDIDPTGAGKITINDKEYRVHSKAHVSGGVTCTRMFDDDELLVTCDDVPVPAESLEKMYIATEQNCFDGTMNFHRARDFALGEVVTNATTEAVHGLQSREEDPCSPDHDGIDLRGDGNPKQRYLHKQISENIDCTNVKSCTVGRTESESYSIGFSSSLTGGGWITGGFDVSKSWSTGNTYSCSGEEGDEVCIWYKTAHTAYEVHREGYMDCFMTTCGARCPEADYTLTSPNERNSGGGYYCVIGTCRSKGEQYWEEGRKGGP
ncbi:hypothetical protein BDW42DRAFT_143501 [Aspergillus taichungensis]|uniref:Uncharacterized protein n=1 Tax=Aspergillus taichungensis TaxID=482145 RepID=A0A2J5HMQ7_9EURO|nr:hypothetical protein BDW42DRAFT_143501 [Aspergillus taichungensis]